MIGLVKNVWKNGPQKSWDCDEIWRSGNANSLVLLVIDWLTVGIRTHCGSVERHTTIEYSKNRDRNRTNILWLFLLLVICHLMKYKASKQLILTSLKNRCSTCMYPSHTLCMIFKILVSFLRDNALFASKARINVFWKISNGAARKVPSEWIKYFKKRF